MPSLGRCEEFFVEDLRPHTRWWRRGRRRLFPVGELRRLLDDVTEYAVCGFLSDR